MCLAWLSFIFADCSDHEETINSFSLDFKIIHPFDPDLLLDIDLYFDVDPHLYFTLTYPQTLSTTFFVIITLTFASNDLHFYHDFDIVWESELDFDWL